MQLKLLSLQTKSTLFLLLAIVLIIGFLIPYQTEMEPPLLPAVAKSTFVYKINIDSLEIQYGKVESNQNLSTLLSPYLSPQRIDRIARESRSVFDVRKVRSGNKYARIYTRGTDSKTAYFIYEIDPIHFVVYDLRDSLRIYTDKKKVTTHVKHAEGTISTSLWNAFVDNNLDINLGLKMSDVYAWTIDFYGLQKGDRFKVVYEELYVDDVMIGIDRILGAVFTSSGKDFYAFYFDQMGKGEYFDDEGKSLRRSFLKAPLKFSRISSRFSRARMHPILRISRPHFGVDYAAPRGTPVVSLGDGRVLEVGWHGGYGRFVSIRHNTVYTSTYAHLSKYAAGIKTGIHVQQGQVIGYVGSSGLSTGAHLDFRVYKNGSPTDPLKLESPSSQPVNQKDIVKFRETVARMKQELAN